jgi:hypothetical protein
LWTGAGLDTVETRVIAVTRTFPDFDNFWETTLLGAGLISVIDTMAADDVERLKERVRVRVAPVATGRVTSTGRANAVKGRVPK